MILLAPFYYLGYRGVSLLLLVFLFFRLKQKDLVKDLIFYGIFFIFYILLSYFYKVKIDVISLIFLLFAFFLIDTRLKYTHFELYVYTFLPIFIYVFFLVSNIEKVPSWISYHKIASFGRGSLYFSEPSMLGLYYVNAILMMKSLDKMIFARIFAILMVIYSQSLGAYALLLTFYWRTSLKIAPIALVLGVVLAADEFKERIIYLFSFSYLGTDFASSIGNRLNSAYFIFDYIAQNGFSVLGEGWGNMDTYITKKYDYFSFTDLGRGDIKNILTNIFYYFGFFSLFLFKKLIDKISREKFLVFLVLCFSYNWLQHPIVIITLMTLKGGDKL